MNKTDFSLRSYFNASLHSRQTTLYSGNDAAVSLGVVVVAATAAAFVAGLVAIYVIKSGGKKVKHRSFGAAAISASGIAATATAVIFVGSLAGYLFFDAAGINDARRSLLVDPGWLFARFAVPFFFEAAIALLLANRLVVWGILKGPMSKVALPLASFVVFSVLNVLFWSSIWLVGGADAYAYLVQLWQQTAYSVLLVPQLVIEAVHRSDALFPLIWLKSQVLETGGNQFALAKLYPAVYFVILAFSVAQISLGFHSNDEVDLDGADGENH